MGYILPVDHYQYKDYQNRVSKTKQDPYYIENPYKIIFDTKRQDTVHNFTHQKTEKIYQDVQRKRDKVETIYADLTGKGRNFSKSV